MRTLTKPAGLPVFAPHHNPDGDCVLRRTGGSPHPWPEGFEGGIAHRLDHWTSGALVCADDPEELAQIRRFFHEHQLRKTYCFLSAKDPGWHSNRCDRAIAHDQRHKRRMVVQRGQATPHRGKWIAAETVFERLSGQLWQATMRSGVMHQIRVHAAFVGLPLLGDALYGGGRVPEQRFWLHHVGLTGPITTEPVALPSWAEEAHQGP